MKPQGGGLAAWSIRHPIGVSMIALAVMVLGLVILSRLAIDLLPQIIYPEVRVRIADEGVPASVMEDQVTRQIEEQLAITEDAIGVQSRTDRGLATIDLAFAYGKDMDIALRDASARLDRARRFIPETAEPPLVYKLDPSQIPVMEFVVSSDLLSLVALRSWVDDVFGKWFLNLPGVAAVEVGGGVEREIHILPDQARLAAIGLSYRDLIAALQSANSDQAIGFLQMPHHEFTGRISGRLEDVSAIRHLPIAQQGQNVVYLSDVAQVLDTSADERVRVRADGISGVKLAIQKQPTANTNAVVQVVNARLDWLRSQQIIPEGIEVTVVADQSVYIIQSIRNASAAALSGALLAMLVVYLFLGNLKRTLIIGSAIPIAVLFTMVLMGLSGLTLNIMTLGGLALGVGLLVDNTIVMMENISRHQARGTSETPALQAAQEVHAPILASTSTNLAAVLPFLFVGGLTGLIFSELIFTISAAIFASMLIALTLVPAYAARVQAHDQHVLRRWIDAGVAQLQNAYAASIAWLIRLRLIVVVAFVVGLGLASQVFLSSKQVILPNLDDGLIQVRITTDSGISVEEMDQKTAWVEHIVAQQPETQTVFTLVGGSVFGRSQRETPNQSNMTVQLAPLAVRGISSAEWMRRVQAQIQAEQMAGLEVQMSQRGIRGLRTSRGDDDLSIRIQGPDFGTLKQLADDLTERLRTVPSISNLRHSAQELSQELSITLDRQRASALGLTIEDLTQATQIALQGQIISQYLDGDRAYPIRLRLSQQSMATPQALESIILFPGQADAQPVYLGTVARLDLIETPSVILRDNQMRIVELTASVRDGFTLGEALADLAQLRADVELPDGYTLYDGGTQAMLQQQQALKNLLLLLALFLVFVVMAIQYESLLNPLVILLSVPFAAIGVALGVYSLGLPLSMPVWLGLIMLVGIVVNNAILLVNTIELERPKAPSLNAAVIAAARLRLRPILMTTLSTVVGMLPLAIGVGEGGEMLQPLAIVVVWGLSFSMLVSLVLVPMVYHLLHSLRGRWVSTAG